MNDRQSPVRGILLAQRNALIDEQITAGITSPTEIADNIKDAEPFRGMHRPSLIVYCSKYRQSKGVNNDNSKLAKRYALIDEQIATGITTTVEIANKLKDNELFKGLSYDGFLMACRRRLRAKGVYTKMMVASNRASNKAKPAEKVKPFSELERKIANLESELAGLRSHQCSEAEMTLQNENQELRTENRQLRNRIEVLSRSTAPRVTARPGFGG